MYKLILLFALSLFSTDISASCCSFEIAYVPEALDLPSENSILSCIKEQGCDSLFLFTRRMIHAKKNSDINSVSKNFERILSIIKSRDKRDVTSLKIIYLYATFLEEAEKTAISSAYYNYIELNSSKNSVLNILSRIGLAGIENDKKKINQVKSLVVKNLEKKSLTTPEELSVLIRLSNYLDIGKGISFSQNNPAVLSIHSRNDLDSELYYIYLIRFIVYLVDAKDIRFNDFFRKSQGIYHSLPQGKYYQSNLNLQSIISAANGQYDKSLDEIEEALRLSLGPSETLESILNTPPVFTAAKYQLLYQYALKNLYQTRVRSGLDPVKKAFTLYNTFFIQTLSNSLSSFSNVTADRHTSSNPIKEITILVVGCYLYQHTNKRSYLDKAISIIDRSTGAGNYFWASVKKFAQDNESFRKEILIQKSFRSALLSINSKTSLATIFHHQTDLEKQREAVKSRYSIFFDNITNHYQIDLSQVSTSCAQDSSGILAFYNIDRAMYRLLVTPDTISITNMNHLVPQVASLITKLKTTPNPKTKPNENAKPSRELYSLLFDGIDSLLSPNLHIIATGELENIPFNALRREAPGEEARYLGIEVALSRQMSIGSMRLMEEQEMSPRYNRPLGMAPSFNNEALAISELRQAGFVLPPLMYSTDEVEDLEARGPGSFFYGEEANIPNYLANVSDHSIIHLATHAISSQADGLESRIYLASEGEETSELYLSDIGDQTLNADLVVLSACETGSGSQHATEGRISLTKAYLAAGARSVVSSNWAVDDFATAALMKFFYQHIQEGKPPHQALQLSRKAYLEKYPDAPPYKWAAFDAYGGMKPVRWDRSRSKWPLVGYGALGLVVVGLGAGYLRRQQRRQAA